MPDDSLVPPPLVVGHPTDVELAYQFANVLAHGRGVRLPRHVGYRWAPLRALEEATATGDLLLERLVALAIQCDRPGVWTRNYRRRLSPKEAHKVRAHRWGRVWGRLAAPEIITEPYGPGDGADRPPVPPGARRRQRLEHQAGAVAVHLLKRQGRSWNDVARALGITRDQARQLEDIAQRMFRTWPLYDPGI